MKLRRHLISLLALAAGLSAFTAPAISAEYKAEYRLSLVLGPPTPWGQAGKMWADMVKERTQGRINIKLYPGVSLIQGDQTREFSALRQGVIDMAVGSTINWSPQVKELNLFSLPFLMPDYAAIAPADLARAAQAILAHLHRSPQPHQLVVPGAGAGQGFQGGDLAPAVQSQRVNGTTLPAGQCGIAEVHVHGQGAQLPGRPVESHPLANQGAPGIGGMQHLEAHPFLAPLRWRQHQPADPPIQGPQCR